MLKKKTTGGWLESVKTIFYAALIAIGIRTIAFEPFNIPSGSMIPTLLVGDYLFVSKFSYGYSRHSMPFSPNLFDGRIFGSLPRRGDVAVFKLPRDGATDYIKRIIGLPGGSRFGARRHPPHQRAGGAARIHRPVPRGRRRPAPDRAPLSRDAAGRAHPQHHRAIRRRPDGQRALRGA
jgi:hypothetical protein